MLRTKRIIQNYVKMTLILNVYIQPSEPDRMKYHMKSIKSLGSSIEYKMSLYLLHSPLHSQVLSLRYPI